MDYNNISNVVGEAKSRALEGKCSFLDKNNIVMKYSEEINQTVLKAYEY